MEGDVRIAAAESQVVDDGLAVLVRAEIRLAIVWSRSILSVVYVFQRRHTRMRSAHPVKIVQYVYAEVSTR